MNDLIKNWPASIGDALKGTKYAGANKRLHIPTEGNFAGIGYMKRNIAYSDCEADAKQNAAKAVISEQIIRELVEAYKAQEQFDATTSLAEKVVAGKRYNTAIATAQAWLAKLEVDNA